MVASADDLEAWDRVAEVYATVVGQEWDSTYLRFRPFLEEHLGDVSGLRLLDLGCGHGWLAGIYRSRGAVVVGVDGSRELLTVARAAHPTIDFKHADLADGLPEVLSSQVFDRVVAHMVVMDIPDLEPLAAALRRCVAADAIVLVTLTHPSFFMQSPVQDPASGEWYRRVKGYLEHQEWWVTSFGGHRHYHRPLEFYVKWLASAGLVVIDIHEPPVPIAKPSEAWDDRDRWFETIPTMIGLAAVPLSRV